MVLLVLALPFLAAGLVALASNVPSRALATIAALVLATGGLAVLAIPGEMYRFIPAIAASEGFKVVEIPVNHRARQHGKSKYGFERYLRGLLDLMTISIVGRYRHRPMHLFGGAGLLLFAIGVIIGIYLTIIKILGEAIGTRPLLILAVLLIVVRTTKAHAKEIVWTPRKTAGNRG